MKKAEELAGAGYSVEVFDPSKSLTLNDKGAEQRLRFLNEIQMLDVSIQGAKAAGIQWLETNRDVIAFLCGGKFPEAGYMIYKDMRLCLPGTAEEIAKKERLTVHEKLFVKDGISYIAKKNL